MEEDIELDIENKYLKYKKNTKFTIKESLYILKSRYYIDEIEDIAINCLIEFLEDKEG